uniref:uncharacterized protein si:dkey-262k9.2 isoform X2 n=1 Tax=Scatophagus argus TaxID=75038 RepID=UPI001ED823C2|nr:uncharacterized protein si:dkey-262k9.2 isoform X2 [Scatophagus argus]
MVDSSLVCVAQTEHLKMMRLLFLCLLLLLPAATAVSEEDEGSADEDVDDEDLIEGKTVIPHGRSNIGSDSLAGKTTGTEESSDHFTLIVIVVAVTTLTLSVATLVTIMLVRRHMHSRQQGIYSVPTEQDHKGV